VARRLGGASRRHARCRGPSLATVAQHRITLQEALEHTRTGDVWVFRGRTVADRAIQLTTNSPVNHVGMCLALDDLPPLMWHAELGRALPDLWTGAHQRGVQLHDLEAAVEQWAYRYGQRAWLRQLDRPVDVGMEDAVLRTVARLDGAPFPSTARLFGRWLGGRVPAWRERRCGRGAKGNDQADVPAEREWPHLGDDRPQSLSGDPRAGEQAPGRVPGRAEGGPASAAGKADENTTGRRPDAAQPRYGDVPTGSQLESAYCAEVVAITYQAMGLLPPGRRPNWYDPGRFWSGDELDLADGYRLGAEIAVDVPVTTAGRSATTSQPWRPHRRRV
jgi:hypothetical protein